MKTASTRFPCLVWFCFLVLAACNSRSAPVASGAWDAGPTAGSSDFAGAAGASGGFLSAIPDLFKLSHASFVVGTVGTVTGAITATDRHNATGEAARVGVRYIDYECSASPFRPERILLAYGLCEEKWKRGEIVMSYVETPPEHYPKYLDEKGVVITPPPPTVGPASLYGQRRPMQTLVSGERILVVALCPSATSRQGYAGCTNPLSWKFPVSADGKVDFSSLQGPVGLTLDEAEQYLVASMNAFVQGEARPPTWPLGGDAGVPNPPPMDGGP